MAQFTVITHAGSGSNSNLICSILLSMASYGQYMLGLLVILNWANCINGSCIMEIYGKKSLNSKLLKFDPFTEKMNINIRPTHFLRQTSNPLISSVSSLLLLVEDRGNKWI